MTKGWFVPLLFTTLAMAQTEMRTRFEVRYVASGAVYLAGGREEGLQEGFRLRVKRLKPGEPELSAQTITQLVVTAVAAHSAVCSIETPDAELQTGDIAEVMGDNLELLQTLQQSKSAQALCPSRDIYRRGSARAGAARLSSPASASGGESGARPGQLRIRQHRGPQHRFVDDPERRGRPCGRYPYRRHLLEFHGLLARAIEQQFRSKRRRRRRSTIC